MANIVVLDQGTIDKIAAGEVIERPASIVKELMENAIDAKASAITVEIKEGGTALVRITDNGCGIPKDQVRLAFMRHATSKIRSVEDLITVSSLGFRGEALSSIAAVAQVELITKTGDSLTGTRYQIEGGTEKSIEEVGAPEGTTFLVRNLFYNTPVRRKFLKTPMAEGSHVAELVERLALSRPDISIRFIYNNQNRLHTAGNHNLKDIIYTVYGREIASNLLPVDVETDLVQIHGFIGKPVIARGNRNFENYFINRRYIKSSLISKAIEDAYKTYMMQHKYPFTVLHFTIESTLLDVNVHPTKMEIRFRESEQIYETIYNAVGKALTERELIPKVGVKNGAQQKESPAPAAPHVPEPFERRRMALASGPETVRETGAYKSSKPLFLPQPPKERGSEPDRPNVKAALEAGLYAGAKTKLGQLPEADGVKELSAGVQNTVSDGGTPVSQAFPMDKSGSETPETKPDSAPAVQTQNQESNLNLQTESEPDSTGQAAQPAEGAQSAQREPADQREAFDQMDLFEEKLLSKEAAAEHKIIGQLFDTYWLVEYKDQLFFVDQHAAHEKVLYEKTMASLSKREFTSQFISPPIILTLTPAEETLLREHMEDFQTIGFEIEPFGGKEYAVRAVPDNLFSIAKKDLLMEMLDSLSEDVSLQNSNMILEKVASMSCKAAVKGGWKLSEQEARKLIAEQLLELTNPYTCPHGRPVIVSMSKREIEKNFKRIL